MSDGGRLFLGLISGTSFDAIDAAVIRVANDRSVQFVGGHETPLPQPLREGLIALREPLIPLDRLAALDSHLGEAFAEAAQACLQSLELDPDQIAAIGSHGQTLWHRPQQPHSNTLQIGNPAIIAERLGRPVVADLRRADMAAGGQGAPLVPPFHQALFASRDEDRAILNLGGIANLTLLPADNSRPVTGFDTGPANGLLDEWMQHCLGQPCDRDGQLASAGSIDRALLESWLAHPYFDQRPPKSTGREVFTMARLQTDPRELDASPADVAATLVALTAESIARALKQAGGDGFDCRRVIAMGGGVRNPAIMEALRGALGGISLSQAEDHGWDSGLIEASAFAWLAARRLDGLPGNLASVTGASGARQLGAVYG